MRRLYGHSLRQCRLCVTVVPAFRTALGHLLEPRGPVPDRTRVRRTPPQMRLEPGRQSDMADKAAARGARMTTARYASAADEADFSRHGVVYQIGLPPGRIDILTECDATSSCPATTS